MHATTMDIDQAFEACEASLVGAAWLRTEARYSAIFKQPALLVRRGKTCRTSHGRTSFGRGWYSIRLEHIHRALVASSMLSLVALGTLIFWTRGISIGGTLSCAAVGVYLGDQELQGLIRLSGDGGRDYGLGGSHLEENLSWRRYVDDILAGSFRVCSECQAKILRSIFAEQLSTVYTTPRILTPSTWSLFDWLDVTLGISRNGLFWIPKNANREWLRNPGRPEDRPRPIAHPWPGTLSVPFGRLRGILMGKLARAFSLGTDPIMECLVLLEIIIELALTGYPTSVLRALVHALPTFPAVRMARVILRKWMRVGASNAAAAPLPSMGKGYGSQGPWHKDQRGRQDQRDGRGGSRGSSWYGGNNWQPSYRRQSSRHRTRSSSSTSSGSRNAKKVAAAQKTLKKLDPECKRMVEADAEARRSEEAKKHGAALMAIVSEQFDQYIATARDQLMADLPQAAGHRGHSAERHAQRSPRRSSRNDDRDRSRDRRRDKSKDKGQNRDEEAGPPPAAGSGGGKAAAAAAARGEEATEATPRRHSVKGPIPGTAPAMQGLTTTQKRWANAELKGYVKFLNGGFEHFRTIMLAKWADTAPSTRTFVKRMEEIFKEYQPEFKIPRSKEERIKALFQLFAGGD